MIEKTGSNSFHNSGAVFSDCMLYRYRLWRIWNPNLPKAVFVLMNPSTADETKDDPTVLRCQWRVSRWPADLPAVGGVEVVNVFAWRETDSTKLPGLIANGTDIIGPDNDNAIREAVQDAAIVICGWGAPGNLLNRGKSVLRLIHDTGKAAYCLRLNKDGDTPGHPLYISYKERPVLVPFLP